ncbi:MAG: proton-conducting transporter membrane subunit [Bradyrhizobium sp.]
MPDATTSGGILLVLAIVLPVVGILLSLIAGGRQVERIALVVLPFNLIAASAIFADLWRSGRQLVYIVGDWQPPLGVTLRADGLSAAMIVTTAVVIGVFAHADFDCRAEPFETRTSFVFWMMLMAIGCAMNLIFLGGDLFTLYVALELLTFAAVPLVCLDGRAETIQAALRYLLFALLGSILYLVGTALLYGSYATLDIALLSQRVRVETATLVAAVLMTVGLFAKTALFPLHLWLPPAHAGAPAAASAVLSAVVVKGSFFLVVRLWFGVMPDMLGFVGAQLVGVLGAGAILFGSIVALWQNRLKLLIAYSTVAQIGYLFLMFPLALDPVSEALHVNGALAGGMLLAMSHATAKAAMFMAAGLIYAALGHDRIVELGGAARALPMTVFAFAIGGVCLIGLPPSAGFLAKWLLLKEAIATGQWPWAMILLVGGLFSGAYVFIVVSHALVSPQEPLKLRAAVPKYQEAAALTLALISLLLGFVAFGPIDVLQVGPGATMEALR